MALFTRKTLLPHNSSHHHLSADINMLKGLEYELMMQSPQLQKQTLNQMIYYPGLSEDKLFNPVSGGFNVNAPNLFIQKIRSIYYLMLVCVFEDPLQAKDIISSIVNTSNLKQSTDMFSSQMLVTKYGSIDSVQQVRIAFGLLKLALYNSQRIPKNRKKYFVEFIQLLTYSPKGNIVNKISKTINKFPIIDEILIDCFIQIIGDQTLDDNLNIQTSFRQKLGLECQFLMFREFTIENIKIMIKEDGFRVVENDTFAHQLAQELQRISLAMHPNANPNDNNLSSLLDVSRVDEFQQDIFIRMDKSYIFELEGLDKSIKKSIIFEEQQEDTQIPQIAKNKDYTYQHKYSNINSTKNLKSNKSILQEGLNKGYFNAKNIGSGEQGKLTSLMITKELGIIKDASKVSTEVDSQFQKQIIINQDSHPIQDIKKENINNNINNVIINTINTPNKNNTINTVNNNNTNKYINTTTYNITTYKYPSSPTPTRIKLNPRMDPSNINTPNITNTNTNTNQQKLITPTKSNSHHISHDNINNNNTYNSHNSHKYISHQGKVKQKDNNGDNYICNGYGSNIKKLNDYNSPVKYMDNNYCVRSESKIDNQIVNTSVLRPIIYNNNYSNNNIHNTHSNNNNNNSNNKEYTTNSRINIINNINTIPPNFSSEKQSQCALIYRQKINKPLKRPQKEQLSQTTNYNHYKIDKKLQDTNCYQLNNINNINNTHSQISFANRKYNDQRTQYNSTNNNSSQSQMHIINNQYNDQRPLDTSNNCRSPHLKSFKSLQEHYNNITPNFTHTHPMAYYMSEPHKTR